MIWVSLYLSRATLMTLDNQPYYTPSDLARGGVALRASGQKILRATEIGSDGLLWRLQAAGEPHEGDSQAGQEVTTGGF